MTTFQKIYSVVSNIPDGKVSTYKQVADRVGLKNPRIVGFALHKNNNPKAIPCHRVIKSDGTIAKGYAFGGFNKQKEKLEKEGVKFLSPFKVDLNRCLHK